MGAQNGKDLLIKVDVTGGGQFETIAGLRATRISFNAETVEVTSLESQGGWRGCWLGRASRRQLFPALACSGTPTRMRVRGRYSSMANSGVSGRHPRFRRCRGAFQVTGLEHAGLTMARRRTRCRWRSAAAELRGGCLSHGQSVEGRGRAGVDGKPHVARLTLGALAELEAGLESGPLWPGRAVRGRQLRPAVTFWH